MKIMNKMKKYYYLKKEKELNVKHNLIITYKDLTDANNTFKKLVSERKSELQDKYDANRNCREARLYSKLIQQLSKFDNKQFPVLNVKTEDIDIIPEMKDYCQLNHVLRQIKLLKTKIKNKLKRKKSNKAELTSILKKMQNDNIMSKSLFRKLKNIGIITNSKNYIHLYENKETQKIIGKQRIILNQLEDIYDKLKKLNNTEIINGIKKGKKSDDILYYKNILRDNIAKFYEILMNTNNIELMFKRNSGIADYIPRNIENTVKNISPMLSVEENVVFGIDRIMTSFIASKEQFTIGLNCDYDFSESFFHNLIIIGRYYGQMLRESSVFWQSYAIAVLKCNTIINILKKYNNNMSNNLINFIDNNNKKIKINWRHIICYDTRKEIVTKLCFNQLKKKSLTEILNIFKDKINNNSTLNNDNIGDFITYVLCNNEVLDRLLQDNDITNFQILNDILSNKYVVEFITKQSTKNVFHNNFMFIKRNLRTQNNDTLRCYNKSMERNQYRLCNALNKLKNKKDIVYPEGLNDLLDYYYNEVNKAANLEYEKYKYAYKYIFDIDKAIVPADFWKNKLIEKFNIQ